MFQQNEDHDVIQAFSHFGGLLYGREMQGFFSGTNGNSVTNLYTKNNMWLVEKILQTSHND